MDHHRETGQFLLNCRRVPPSQLFRMLLPSCPHLVRVKHSGWNLLPPLGCLPGWARSLCCSPTQTGCNRYCQRCLHSVKVGCVQFSAWLSTVIYFFFLKILFIFGCAGSSSQIQSVSFQQQHHVPYVDLLLWDNLWGCKQSLLYLNKEGGFRQCFPNTFNNLCLMEVESKFQTG